VQNTPTFRHEGLFAGIERPQYGFGNGYEMSQVRNTATAAVDDEELVSRL